MTKIRVEEHSATLTKLIAKYSDDAKNKTKPGENISTKPEERQTEHLHRYFLQRLKLKKKHIKHLLIMSMKEENLKVKNANDTQ